MLTCLRGKSCIAVIIGVMLFLVALSPAHAGVALVGNVSASGNAPTTASMDTTGATLLILGQSCFSGACTTPTDSKGNNWTALTQQNTAGGNRVSVWYAWHKNGGALSVGTGHTFTGSAIDYGLCVMAFSGTNTTSDPLEFQNGSVGASTTATNTGNITPGANGALVISYLGASGPEAVTYSVNSGFSITNQMSFSGGLHYGQGCAYLLQSTAQTVGATWSHAETSTEGATIASFRAALASGGSSCSYSGSGDWVIRLNDNCVITTVVNVSPNNVIMNGTGTCYIGNGGHIITKKLSYTPASLNGASTFGILTGGKLAVVA